MTLYDIQTKEKSKQIPMFYTIEDETAQILSGDSFGGHTFFNFVQNHNSILCRIEFEGVANKNIIDFKLPKVKELCNYLENIRSHLEK